MQALRIEVDDDLPLVLQRTAEELAVDLRLAATVNWYELGTISREKAAQIPGLNRSAFIEALGRFGVSPFQQSADDIVAALRDA